MSGGEPRATRRVVTGHDARGTSVVLTDGPVPVRRRLPEDGVAFDEVWCTPANPAPIAPIPPVEPTEGELRVPPPRGGTRIRINTFAPGHLDEGDLQSPVHRTESIDYGIVLEGEIVLVLDEDEVTLRAGDVVVQRGTDHAWANRANGVARVAFVLVDGAFTPDLRAILPDDLALMHRAPRDERTQNEHHDDHRHETESR